MTYNFLRDAYSITNSTLCRYDSINGYTTDFSNNGDVDGWNIYNNIYMYGCWDSILFGSTYLSECYISRTEVFLSVNAEEYFFIEFILKVVDENPQKVVKGLKKGKVMWQRTDDSTWSVDRTIEFDITGIGTWEYYKLNLGPYKWWQGDINNLRFYPFIDGHTGDKFFLKFLRITSEDFWMCTNTSCSFYQYYTHPCPGSGKRAYCESIEKGTHFDIIQGINSELYVNIDDYGFESIELGTHVNITGRELAKVIGNSISTINLGGYSFVRVDFTENNTFKIYSGTNRNDSSVVLKYSEASEYLGFFNDAEEILYQTGPGENPATGFDYASTKLLQTFEINALVDDSINVAYVHNPSQYSIEGGRRDFNEIGTSKLISELNDSTGYISFDNVGKTLIDLSKRIDNNGKLTHFWVYGRLYQGASLKICRPHNDSSFTVVHTIALPMEDPTKLYTARPIVSRVDCDVLVNKGDILGVYNVDIYVGQTSTELPDATFMQFIGDITGRVAPTFSFSYGVGGFALYARGDLKQTNTVLDIDLGDRINVSEFVVSGEEFSDYYEFNLASCLDVTWSVDLFGESHNHSGNYLSTGYSWYDTHTNIYYGKSCLDDMVVTADNGKVGDVYGQNSGLSTSGDHSYFYVNGDFEWPYSSTCTGRTEYCGDKYPKSGALNYERDPIAFNLNFPATYKFDVHKSIIYFKEENNFRNIALSTYVDSYYWQGNADVSTHILVPQYKYVYVNGVRYALGDNDNIDRYLFKNPASNDIFSSDYNNEDKTADHISSYFVDWTILGHEFEPINCRGFRIYCNKHSSTKITEIELYSRIPNDTSMVDNTILYFSDYGDKWRTAGFKVRDSKTTYAFIGGTPRYFRVLLESQTPFNMRELSISVTEQTYVEDDVVLIEDARQGTIGRSKAVMIQNTYDKAFDLTVDIPRDLLSTNNIVYWNTLNSHESLNNTEFGPSALLYKNSDFPITYNRGQCANNCYSYGLINLIDNKEAYYCFNTYDWFSFGTTFSGVSLDFDNSNYLARYKFSGSINPLSSKFWRFLPTATDRVLAINDLLVFYQQARVSIIKLLLPDTIPSTGDTFIISDGSNIPSYYTFKDSFSSGTFYEFSIFGSKIPSASVVNNTYLNIVGRGGDITLSTYQFVNGDNFEFNFHYKLPYLANILAGTTCTWEFYSFSSKKFHMVWTITETVQAASCSSTSHSFKIYVNDVEIYSNNTLGCYLNVDVLNKVTLRKSGGWISLYLGDHIFITTFAYSSSEQISQFYFKSSSHIASVQVHRVDFQYKVLLSSNSWIGVETHNNEPLDSFVIISTGNNITMNVLAGENNTNYSTNIITALTRTNLNIQLAIDFVKRHSLSIVRNYGIGNLFDISIYINTLFSKNSGSINEAIFDSTSSDCRWLSIQIPCSDNVLKSLEKIGVYTDLTRVLCADGGYNNSWVTLPTNLTTYVPIINVVLNSTVSGTTYFKENFPEKAADGVSNIYDTSYCWAFESGTSPKLYVEFGDEFYVDTFILHHGYSPFIPQGYVKSFKFSLDNTISGTSRTWVQKVNVTGLSNSSTVSYKFDYVYARRALLEILSFDTVEVSSGEKAYNFLDKLVGYIREIEILSRSSLQYISSEDYPIVCLNLRDTFQVVDVKLYNSFTQGSADLGNALNNYWDNNSLFIKYSDTLTDEPHKALFSPNQTYTKEYDSAFSTGDLKYSAEYLLAISIFIPKGHHYLDWEAYYPTTVEGISIDFEGLSKFVFYATNYGNGWLAQKIEFFTEIDDYYNIYVRQNIDPSVSWGARNVSVYRLYGLTKWVSIVRDTATNYSYDFTSSKDGPDYLDRVEVYGGDKYIPTEYWWWWTSDISSLSNDSIYTKVNRRSLKVLYPASSSPDTLRVIEADYFGKDLNWSISDSLHFYLFVDNIANLDTSYGQITFGSIKGTKDDFYYWWDISKLFLVSGWNEIKLNFYDYSGVYPINTTSYSQFLETDLDLKNNNRNITTLTIRYRGKGTAFTLFLDGFKIRRNDFDTDVKYNKGLCLTYNDYLMLPLSNITLDRGSLEFWVKMGVDTLGRDYFGNMQATTLFTLSNNINDIISLRIKPGNWFEVFAGNIRNQSIFNVSSLPVKSYIKRGSLVHIGLVWSNTGLDIPSGNTVQLYINGVLTLNSFSTWEVSDTKLAFFKLGGGITQTSQIFDTQSNFTYENIKIYNYCKTDFLINKQDVSGDYLYRPENFIQISKDDINFYGIGSTNLPLIFEQVSSLESVTVYIRTIKDKNLDSTSSNARILIDWLTTV